MKKSFAAAALPALFLLVAPLAAQDAKYVPATPQLKAGIVNKLPQPQYPAALRDQTPRPTGSATLRVYVGASGTVDSIKLVKSSGNPELDKHAQDFARKSFKFSPYKVGPTPTPWMFDWTASYRAPATAAKPAATPSTPAYTPPSSSAAGAPAPAYGGGRR